MFKPGDVVRLKSGGCKMTVASVFDDPSGKKWLHCMWFKPTAWAADGSPASYGDLLQENVVADAVEST